MQEGRDGAQETEGQRGRAPGGRTDGRGPPKGRFSPSPPHHPAPSQLDGCAQIHVADPAPGGLRGCRTPRLTCPGAPSPPRPSGPGTPPCSSPPRGQSPTCRCRRGRSRSPPSSLGVGSNEVRGGGTPKCPSHPLGALPTTWEPRGFPVSQRPLPTAGPSPSVPPPGEVHRGTARFWGAPGFGVLPAGQGSPLTVGLPGGAAAAQPHDDGSVGQLALHAVLADAVQDVGREMDVQVAQEHDAVLVLGGAGRSERNSPGGEEPRARAGPCPRSPPPCPRRPGARPSARNSPCAAGTGTWERGQGR